MKNKIQFLIAILLVAGTISVQAQRGLKYADSQYDQFNFEAAAALYEDALNGKKAVPDRTYVLTRIADCYRLMNQSEPAEGWYAKAMSAGGVEDETIYHYAQMLRANQKYDAAIEEFERFLTKQPENQEVSAIVDGLYRIEEISKINPEYDVRIAPFNTEGSDFGPYVHKDKLIYATNGQRSGKAKIDVWTNKIFLQLFEVNVAGYDQFSDVQKLNNKSNGLYHDGPVCVDSKTKDIYITRNNYVNRKATEDEEDIVNLKIMRQVSNGGASWGGDLIDDFPFNSDDYSVGHASISKDGQHIYFASDMPHEDAIGGVDIYMATRQGDSWGDLVNLGSEINTIGDDMFPFITDHDHLLYASNGKEGLGGLDLFEAIPDENGGWDAVYNMGAPLNTNHDDFALVFKGEKREGFFTSNRPSEFGDDDIYSFQDNGIVLIGTVVDALTGEPVCNSNVDLIFAGAEADNVLTKCDGDFRFSVKPGVKYGFEACAEGYYCNVDVTASTEGAEPGDVIRVEIPINKDIPIPLTVIVIDEETKEPISTSTVNLFDGCNGQRFNKQSDEAGKSDYQGAEGCDYYISSMAPTYFPKDVNYSTAGITDKAEVVIELGKQGMFDVADLEDGLVFYHIYYDFDESYIRPDADPDLQRVLAFMSENKEAIVQIESHTDARAPLQYNKTLSENRAKAAKEWLMTKGVSAERLHSVGFGEVKPVNGCVDNVKCSEEEHQLNRRTEFRIIAGRVDTRSLARFDVTVDPCAACPF